MDLVLIRRMGWGLLGLGWTGFTGLTGLGLGAVVGFGLVALGSELVRVSVGAWSYSRPWRGRRGGADGGEGQGGFLVGRRLGRRRGWVIVVAKC